MPAFRKGDEPLAEPYDAEIIQFASQRTQARLKQLKRGPAYEAIIAKVRAKYGPGLQEWKGIEDLTFNFQNLAVESETPDVSMSGGRRHRYRGGVPPMTPMTAQKISGPAPVTNTLTQNVINDAKKLWLSGMAALGTPETVGTTLALGAVGVANPSAAAGAFTLANKLVGVAYGLVTPTTFTLAVLTALLYRNFGNYLEKKDTPPPPTNLQELLTEVKKNLGSAVASKKYGSVRMPSAEIMAALDKLEKAAAAEKAAADAKTAAAAEAAAAAEKEAKVAVDQTITASQTAVDSTIPAETPSTTGGRKTKKRGMKKMRKTRRSMFKY
jgi:hypothetical protein